MGEGGYDQVEEGEVERHVACGLETRQVRVALKTGAEPFNSLQFLEGGREDKVEGERGGV